MEKWNKALIGRIKAKKHDLVRECFDEGAEVNLNQGTRDSPLHAAILAEDLDMVSLLLEHGAKVSGVDLTNAAVFGKLDIMRCLIAGCEDIDAEDDIGHAALHTAATLGHKKVAEFLIENGADLHPIDGVLGATPLDMAAESGETDVVDLLLSKGARHSPRSAAANGDLDCLKSLIKTIDRETASDLLIKAANNGHVEVATFLLEKGADVNANPGMTGTPLHQAVSGKHEKFIRFLLRHGADKTITDFEGDSPSDIADPEIRELLR